jgi:hypothetical protein
MAYVVQIVLPLLHEWILVWSLNTKLVQIRYLNSKHKIGSKSIIWTLNTKLVQNPLFEL